MLASESSVLRERALLARVKATRLQMDARDMLARGRIGKKDAHTEEQEQASETEEEETMEPASRVKKSLDRMLSVLEEDLANVESSIGDKLHVLDKDRDGILTAEELHVSVCYLASCHKSVMNVDTVYAISGCHKIYFAKQ